VQAVVAALAPRDGVEAVKVTAEEEYFPPPPQLRAMLGALQAAVEGGCSSRRPGLPGPLDDDRSWGAARALELLGTP
jgi:4-hydroxy-3-methylbut-2-enyl diphosphate reductase